MAASDASQKPYRGLAYRLGLPLLDTNGDPVLGATSLSATYILDGGVKANVGTAPAETSASSGAYYIDFSAGEMDGAMVQGFLNSPDAVSTPFVLYPSSEVIERGTAQSAGPSYVQLRASPKDSADDWFAYKRWRAVGGTGEGQERIGTAYVHANQRLTVDRDWDVTPDATTVYEIVNDDIASQDFPSHFASLVIDSGSGRLDVNMTAISGDTTAADTAESVFDGTTVSLTNVTIGQLNSVTNIATAVLAASAEGSYSMQQVLRILIAVIAGKMSVSTVGTTKTIVFRDTGDSQDVVTVTINTSTGNRTGITYNP